MLTLMYPDELLLDLLSHSQTQGCPNWWVLIFVKTKIDFQVRRLPCNECGDEQITCLDGIFPYVFFCNRC